MALASASTEGRAEPRSTSHAATSQAGERADDHPADATDTASKGAVDPESGNSAESGGERLQGAVDLTEANASPATGTLNGTAAPSGTAQTGTQVAAAVESSSDGYLRQSAVADATGDAAPEGSALDGAARPAANNASARVPAKQDRPKAQADIKDVGAQAVAVTVAEQSRVPVVTMVRWEETAHGQGSGAPGNAAKSATAENSAGTNGKTTAPLGAANDGPASAANVAGGTTGLDQGVLPQAPAEAFEAGLNLYATAGIAGPSGQTSSTAAGLPAANAVQKGAAAIDSGGAKAGAGASDARSAGAGVADSSLHAAGESQTAAGGAVKAGAAVAAPRAIENGAAQGSMQTLLTPAVAHGAATTQHAAAATPDGARTGKAQDTAASAHVAGEEAVASSGINSARVIQTMGETEMHVGMHSAEFGDISIRTSVSAQQMVTQISLDHNDLSQAISTHLSSVQAKLGEEYGLHASIEINNQGAPLSGGQGEGSQREQQAFGRSSQGKPIVPASAGERVAGVVALSSAGSGHGLDITV